MPSDEPISLTTLATIMTITAAAATTASVGYSLAQGTPDAPKMPELPDAPKMPELPDAPKMPELPAAPTPPETVKPVGAAVQPPDLTKPVPTVAERARASETALVLRRRQGRASTILTGPSGLYSTTATASPVKTLLGA